eukprot:9498408-Pyramimonas_sp.AAC.1
MTEIPLCATDTAREGFRSLPLAAAARDVQDDLLMPCRQGKTCKMGLSAHLILLVHGDFCERKEFVFVKRRRSRFEV